LVYLFVHLLVHSHISSERKRNDKLWSTALAYKIILVNSEVRCAEQVLCR